jgi:hypothetical protein
MIPPDETWAERMRAVAEWMGKKVSDQLHDTRNILPSRMSRDELVDFASGSAMPMAGTIRKAALTPAELSVRGILDMPADRMAELGKAQFQKLRYLVPDLPTHVDDWEAFSKARTRVREEAQRRLQRDAQTRMADQLDPNMWREGPMPNADKVRSFGPNRSGKRRW